MSTPPLCRYGGHTCAACCHGDQLDPSTLTRQLRRHTALFQRWFPDEKSLTSVRLAAYEVLARRGLDLIVGVLLWLPLIAHLVRPWLRRRLACAFLGFEDAAGTRVGCLLHPTRWNGAEYRPKAAFRLLRGLGCGAPDYLCLAAHRFGGASWQDHAAFRRETAGMDWYEFGQAVTRFEPSTGRLELPVIGDIRHPNRS